MTVKVNSINILANNVKTFALDISFICYFVQYYILSTPLILGLASDHVFVSEAYGLWYCISHAIIQLGQLRLNPPGLGLKCGKWVDRLSDF